MGIKGLLGGLTKRYSLINRPLNQSHDSRTCDNLYFDMSNFFLDAIAFSQKSDSEDLTDDIKRNILYEIDSIVHIVQPKKTLFLSFEGPAPFAKQWRKRQRFYQRKTDPFGYTFQYQDLGTQVIEILQPLVEAKIKSDPIWNRIEKVYFAGSFVPGEAENKIFSYIRKMREDSEPGSYDPNQTHWICTNDNDLIVMSLMSHEPYITILSKTVRDSTFDCPSNCVHIPCHAISRNSFKTIDISLLRDYLFVEFRNDERILDDIAFLCLTLGSDYIPDIKELEKIKFEDIIEQYTILFNENKFIIENNQIIWENLITFLENCMKLNNPQYLEHSKKNYAERFQDQTIKEQETKKLCRQVIESFVWTFQLYKTTSVPSWSWIYGNCFIPPLEFIIEEMRNYHPSFPLEGESESSKIPTNHLEVNWITLKPVDKLFPPNLLEIRSHSDLIKKWSIPVEEVVKDQKSGLFILPIPNLDELRAELQTNVIPFIPPEYNNLTELKKVIEIKSKTELDLLMDDPKPFTSQNLSTLRPPGVPSFLSGPFEGATYGGFRFSNGEIHVPHVSSHVDINGYVTIWPYSQTYRAFGKGAPKDFAGITKKYNIVLDNVRVPSIKLIPIEPLTFQEYKEFSFSYPITLCSFYQPQNPPQNMILKCRFPTILTTLQGLNERWLTLGEIATQCGVPANTLKKNILLNKISSKKDCGMQFYTDKLKHIVPFYVKTNGSNSIKLSEECIPYIMKYIEIVGKEHLTEKPNDEIYNKLGEFLTTTRSELPFYSTDSSTSFTVTTVSLIEEEINNMTPIADETQMKVIELQRCPPTNKFTLGQTVVVVDDRSPAPIGSTGVIVNLDNKSQEAWVVMHDFDNGITFGQTLHSYRGLIINYYSLRVVA